MGLFEEGYCCFSTRPMEFSPEEQKRNAQWKRTSNESVWITGMRVFAWIAFIGIIIAGTAISFDVSVGVGILGFIGSVIVACLSVASTMIFLN